MIDFPKRVQINEDGPREGIQIERAVIATEAKIELIDALSQTGLKRIQIVSFVDPRRVPQWADAEAVVAGARLDPSVRYTGLCLNLRGLERAIATGRLHIEGRLSLCASEQFLARNQNATFGSHRATNKAMAERLISIGVPIVAGGVSAAFGCNFQGDIPIAGLLDRIRDLHEMAEEHGGRIGRIGLSDTMGWATPAAIKRVVGAVRNAYPAASVSLHLHDTRGMAMANALAGLQMGVDDFDTSIGALGGCPFAAHKGAAGNLCTEDFAFLCAESGIETGLDIDALIVASDIAERVVGHSLEGRVRKGGLLSAIRVARTEASAA